MKNRAKTKPSEKSKLFTLYKLCSKNLLEMFECVCVCSNRLCLVRHKL